MILNQYDLTLENRLCVLTFNAVFWICEFQVCTLPTKNTCTNVLSFLKQVTTDTNWHNIGWSTVNHSSLENIKRSHLSINRTYLCPQTNSLRTFQRVGSTLFVKISIYVCIHNFWNGWKNNIISGIVLESALTYTHT